MPVTGVSLQNSISVVAGTWNHVLNYTVSPANATYTKVFWTSSDESAVYIPPLTEERRKEIVKAVKSKAEERKVAVRNERRDANEMLKAHQKDSDITEDELKKGLERVQKETDAGIAKIDELASKKEKEVLEL